MMQQVSQAVTQLAQNQQQDRQAIAQLAKVVVGNHVASNLPTMPGTVSPTIPNGAPPLPNVMQPQEPAMTSGSM